MHDTSISLARSAIMSLSRSMRLSLATLAAVFVVGCIGASDEDPDSAADTNEAVGTATPESASDTDEAVGSTQQAFTIDCAGGYCIVTCGRGGGCVHWGGNYWGCGCGQIP
ncbi:hypothetical protein WME79_45800 [Sorangium sp. So ce726]|uniref:hypothetical protein n=1 Tax=Sorangium sp. So ce726 TaxID=3133319 RepID=UPI003F6045D8